MTETETHRAVDAVWRIESARVIGALARMTHDVGLAEEVAHDALLVALESWPATGVPSRPGAWLTAVARRRAIDRIRREERLERKRPLLEREAELEGDDVDREFDRATDDEIGDDVLRLMFVACHPVLSREARTALTLRLLGGLRVDEIARAYLTTEAAISQRIVRAKRTLREAHVPFETPVGAERRARLHSVLEAIYVIFSEGHAATAGDALVRPALCEEALRLGRMLSALVPEVSEVHGLLALMELHASRLGARVAFDGRPVRLLEQDRSRWDRLQIARGLTALARAEALGGTFGPYALQASIAAVHARALRPEETEWTRILALYDALVALAPSPVVALNRAVALAMAESPAAGLEALELLLDDPVLAHSHLLPAVRAELLERSNRFDEAASAFDVAAALARNERERGALAERSSRARDFASQALRGRDQTQA